MKNSLLIVLYVALFINEINAQGPTVYIDDDGQAYLFWGNTTLHYVKLKANMIEMEGDFKKIDLPKFTEAPWVHKRNGWYYLSYAYEFPARSLML